MGCSAALLVLRSPDVIGRARQGKLDEADPLLERAIEIQEKALGPDHPNVALSLGGRAMVLQAQVWESIPGNLYLRSVKGAFA